MCKQTITVTVAKRSSSINELQCLERNKKRRLSTTSSKRRVRFATDEPKVHHVEKISGPYSNRLLWYTKPQLERLMQMEIRRNLACPTLVDSTFEVGGVEELTWRGIEQYKPGNDPSLRRANAKSLVRIITEEYKEQAMTDDYYGDEQLRFLSEAMSLEEKTQARRRGVQDEAFVFGPPPQVKAVKVRTPPQRRPVVISTAHQSNWGLMASVKRSGPSLVDHLSWFIRVVGFFVICGFFIFN